MWRTWSCPVRPAKETGKNNLRFTRTQRASFDLANGAIIMSGQSALTRRQLLAASAAAGGEAVLLTPEAACGRWPNDLRVCSQPLAQDYIVVAETPSPDRITDDPSLTKLPSGRILATRTIRGTKGVAKHSNPGRYNLASSDDGGQNWQRHEPLDINMGLPFVHNGMLYLIGNNFGRRDIIVSRSADEGRSWHPVVTVFEGDFWNAPTGYTVADGRIYRAFDSGGGAGRPCSIVAGDLSKDLLSPKSWRLSNKVGYPGTPEGLTLDRDKYRSGAIRGKAWTDHWLEPNVVEVRGRIMVVLRARIDRYAIPNIAAICDASDNGDGLQLEFSRFCAWPGGQHKFHVIYDDVSELFWMTTNLAIDSQNSLGLANRLFEMGWHSGLGNERRFLMLYYSIDALTWFPAGCVAMSSQPLESFMYAAPMVDGDEYRAGGDSHGNT